MTASVFRISKNYCPQIFSEECKYVFKKKMPEYITDNIEISSEDSNREDSDEKISNEEKSDERKSNEEN